MRNSYSYWAHCYIFNITGSTHKLYLLIKMKIYAMFEWIVKLLKVVIERFNIKQIKKGKPHIKLIESIMWRYLIVYDTYGNYNEKIISFEYNYNRFSSGY
jgi:hypothetical protein